MTTAQIVYWSIGLITAIIWLLTREEVTIATIIIGIPLAAFAWPILALYMVIRFSDCVVLWRKK